MQGKLQSVLLAAPGVKHPDLLGRQDEEYWEEIEDEEAREGDELWEDAGAGDDEAALETAELAEEMDRESASKPAGGKARAVKPAAARPDLAEAVAEEAEERAEEAAEVAAEEAEEAAIEAELQARQMPTTPGCPSTVATSLFMERRPMRPLRRLEARVEGTGPSAWQPTP